MYTAGEHEGCQKIKKNDSAAVKAGNSPSRMKGMELIRDAQKKSADNLDGYLRIFKMVLGRLGDNF